MKLQWQGRLTQHKRFALRTYPNFGFAETSFMLGTLFEILISCLSKFADKIKSIDIAKGIIGGATKKIGAHIIVGRISKELGLLEVFR